MGKAKKIKVSKGHSRPEKVGLTEQIEREKMVKAKLQKKVRYRNDDDEEQMELEDEYEFGESLSGKKPVTKLGPDLSDNESDESDSELSGNEDYIDIEINEEDERSLQMFMLHDKAPTRSLADIIMGKLNEKKN
ncbi:hypothetical protein PV325_001862 [Microctonus aethiopoides]|nr:hypothetical protein PV325_001862 [Microctonus aethiopoides]